MPDKAASEVGRVAARFALVALAGEAAREVTGWQERAAYKAAGVLFKEWLAERGTSGGSDAAQVVAQVLAFIEAHGASRFQWLNAVNPDDAARVINRAGFKRRGDDHATEYLVLPETFKREVVKGYDAKMATRALADAGLLSKDSAERPLSLSACRRWACSASMYCV